MSRHRPSSTPVLIYLSHPSPAKDAPLEGEMLVKYRRDENTFTIFLEFSVDSIPPKKITELRYDADKISAALEQLAIPLSPAQLSVVQRQNGAELRTLQLSSKAPCAVSCSQALDDAGLRAFPLRQLTAFAQAESVNVVFDLKCFKGLRMEGLRRLLGQVNGKPLAGVGVNPHDGKYKPVNLALLSKEECLEPPREPPSYEQTRGEDVLASRPCTPGSPTEKATTAPTPSPKPPPSPLESNLSGSRFTAVIESAVSTLLPDLLPAVLDTALTTLDDTPRLHASVADLVQNALTDLPALQTALASAADAAMHDHFNATLNTAEDILQEHGTDRQLSFGLFCADRTNETEREMADQLAQAVAKTQRVVRRFRACADTVYGEFCERVESVEGVGLLQGMGDLTRLEGRLVRRLDKLRRARRRARRERVRLGEERRRVEEECVRAERERRKLQKERRKLIKARRDLQKEARKDRKSGSETPEVGFQGRRLGAASNKGEAICQETKKVKARRQEADDDADDIETEDDDWAPFAFSSE